MSNVPPKRRSRLILFHSTVVKFAFAMLAIGFAMPSVASAANAVSPAAGGAAAPVPAQDRSVFVADAMRALSGAGGTNVSYDESDFSLHVDKSVFGLDNLFVIYQRTLPNQRDAMLSSWFSTQLQMVKLSIPTSLTLAQAHVFARLRPASQRLMADGLSAASGKHMISQPFAGDADIDLGVVYDQPAAVATISSSFLTTWNTDEAALFQMGLANLAKPPSKLPWKNTGVGVYESPWKDSYDASRIAVPALFASLSVDGDVVAMIPDRDHLLITGSRNTNGLVAMARYAIQLYDQGLYALTAQPFVYGGGVWQPFKAMPEQVNEDLRQRVALERRASYDAEKVGLQAAYPSYFVASLLVVRSTTTQHVSTIAAWSSAPSLLPKADEIAFALSERDIIRVPWETAERIVGPLEPLLGITPLRYRVDHLPSADQLAQLRSAAH